MYAVATAPEVCVRHWVSRSAQPQRNFAINLSISPMYYVWCNTVKHTIWLHIIHHFSPCIVSMTIFNNILLWNCLPVDDRCLMFPFIWLSLHLSYLKHVISKPPGSQNLSFLLQRMDWRIYEMNFMDYSQNLADYTGFCLLAEHSTGGVPQCWM